ncbi:uncharacterized protein LOC123309732 isoform X1 [Coccinella septempunctata]|uniref:uncharacterized protein LOC123309732 isoform X1 n=1 Tax=Coccinella septempunctata TaxID=41139 RepID=UPI001D0828BE|nr:uncharacterized protein LOC123309732 isoform X1 [Coccinella septempunctata]
MERSGNSKSESSNPNNDKYWKSRGYQGRPDNWQDLSKKTTLSKESQDNRSRQMNPNNDAYYKSRQGKY